MKPNPTAPLPTRHVVAAALLVAAALPAHAINNGTPTAAFGAVGVGVQVTPDWVLSTVHTTYQVGDSYSNGYGQRVVAAYYTAPGSGTFPANDIQLLRLAPAATTAPYLAVAGQAQANGTFSPLDVTIASAFNSGPVRGYGDTTVDESAVQIDPDDSGPLGPVTVNYLISHDARVYVQGGDSSGGLFAGHVLDSSVLLGITSAQFQDDHGVPVGSGFVQPAAYRSWIDATMANDGADNEMLQWTTPAAVPEPAAWALWGLGLVLLAGRWPNRSTWGV